MRAKRARVYVKVSTRWPGVSEVESTIGLMHELVDIDQVETRDGRVRAGWECACGSRGSGASYKAAQAGWVRHARTAVRKEEW